MFLPYIGNERFKEEISNKTNQSLTNASNYYTVGHLHNGHAEERGVCKEVLVM